jgi:hypothetical protein
VVFEQPVLQLEVSPLPQRADLRREGGFPPAHLSEQLSDLRARQAGVETGEGIRLLVCHVHHRLTVVVARILLAAGYASPGP